MNRICSTRAELCTDSRSVSNELKGKVSRGVKIRSHLASKSTFTSVFASNFNIVSVITLTLMQRMEIEPILCICILHFLIIASIITARKRSLRRLCFYTCPSVILFMGGGMVSWHALQVVSQHALQVSGGGVSQHALQVSRPTPKGKVEGSGWGVFRPTPGGCIPACTEANPPPATAAGGMHPTGMHSCYRPQ